MDDSIEIQKEPDLSYIKEEILAQESEQSLLVQMKEWSRMQLIYDAALREVNTKLEILNNEFKLTYRYNPIEHITSRIKSSKSIAKKLRHQNREVTIENILAYINDVAGIRIICSFTSDIYRIAEMIAKQSDVKVLKIKDYIANPKENGYTSYHMIVSVPIFLSDMVLDTKVEIQIRTIAMDFWASLEHKMYYKFEGNAPANIRRELKECAELVAFLDKKMLSINEEIKEYGEEEHDEDALHIEEPIKSMYGSVYGAAEMSKEQIEASFVGHTKKTPTAIIDLEEEYEVSKKNANVTMEGNILYALSRKGKKAKKGRQ